MALGIIGGSLLHGLGTGGQNYLNQEEARRREEAANVAAYDRMEHQADLQEQSKNKDQERRKARMLEFQNAAEAWRKDNPQAPVTKFVEHFSNTEYADLLGPAVQAAGLMSTEELRKLQMEQTKAAMAHAKAQEARANASSNREAAASSRAEEKWAMEKAALQEKADEAKATKGLIAGYVESKAQNLPGATEKYATELHKLGVYPEGKPEMVERETKSIDKEGNEIKETRKIAVPARGEGPPRGFMATQETIQGAQIFEDARGNRKAINPATGQWETVVPNPAGRAPDANNAPQAAASPKGAVPPTTADPVTALKGALTEAMARGDAAQVRKLQAALAKAKDDAEFRQLLGR